LSDVTSPVPPPGAHDLTFDSAGREWCRDADDLVWNKPTPDSPWFRQNLPVYDDAGHVTGWQAPALVTRTPVEAYRGGGGGGEYVTGPASPGQPTSFGTLIASGGCAHRHREPVTLLVTGEHVADLCLDCDRQLDPA
jgi:hypothetical protein